MSKYLIVSDLHLSSDRVSNFKKTDLFLKTFIPWKNKQKITATFLNGDIFETWQGKGLTAKGRYEYINNKKEYKELIKNIKEFQFVIGNHDPITSVKNKASEIIIWTIGQNKRFCIMHGHQFDVFFKSDFLTGVSRIACEIWGGFEWFLGSDRLVKVLPKLSDWFYGLKLKNKKSAKGLSDKPYIKDAIQFAKDNDCKIIVNGHTHRAKIVRSNNVIYVNCGSWTDKNANAVIIDVDKQEIILYDFMGGKPKELTKVKVS